MNVPWINTNSQTTPTTTPTDTASTVSTAIAVAATEIPLQSVPPTHNTNISMIIVAVMIMIQNHDEAVRIVPVVVSVPPREVRHLLLLQ